jgi:signal transduction histidine kinase/CheY-like chemotaxis protein/HPt (histidine-containing phosphotransfer) domain-containing protein
MAGWLLLAAAVGLLAAIAVNVATSSDGYWVIIGLALGCVLIAAVLVPGGLRHAHELIAEHDRLTSEHQAAMVNLQQELERHRRLETELKDAKRQTEAAMMAKGEFLATMSHEIRTPLNGILPILDMLLASRLSSEHQELLRTAHGSAKQMLRIVDDILDYSKLEANKVDLETTSFNLRELLESVVRLLVKQAESKGLLLNLEIEPNVRLAVRGDPTRLRQVLSNLLSNAIKFTERGRVTLRVRRLGEQRQHHQLRFEVIDTGIGIPVEKQAQLFKPFSQADASTTRLYGGTGLGLVICQRIITLMGGRIGVESTAGQGSRFWFEVPLLKAVGDLPATRSDLHNAQALVVSGHTPLRDRVVAALESFGMRCSLAGTPADALQQLRAAASRGIGAGFDVLLLDTRDNPGAALMMQRSVQRAPELEGLKLVFLAGREPLAPELTGLLHVRAIAAEAAPSDLRTALEILLVPAVTTDERTRLAEEVAADLRTITARQRVLSAEAETQTTASVSSVAEAAIGRRPRVLLVEDNPVNMLVAQKLLAQMDVICESAGDGERALERMSAGNLDLVLMDCLMPVKDGYSAASEWRQYERAHQLPRLPIIAMTANAMAGDRQKCLDAGMDDYVPKPIDRQLLETTLKRWLQAGASTRRQASASQVGAAELAAASSAPREAARPASSPSVMPRPQPTPAPAAVMPRPGLPPSPTGVPASTAARPAPAATPALDPEVVAELREMMGKEFEALVQLFLRDARGYVTQLEEAAAANDLARMVAPAHTLKSSSANLGAMAVSAAAKRIELGAREGVLPRPAVAVAVLEQEFQRASEALQKLL